MRNVSWKPNGTTRRASSIIGNPGARLPDCTGCGWNGTTGGPGELLHPNRVGYQAMAETIDLKLLAPSPLQKVLAVSSANAEI